MSNVTLRPGGTAHFDLRCLPGVRGDGSTFISVDKIVITPPNDHAYAEMTWDQDVVLQDAAIAFLQHAGCCVDHHRELVWNRWQPARRSTSSVGGNGDCHGRALHCADCCLDRGIGDDLT